LLVIGTAQAADDVVAGKTKAVACAACHGVNGQGVPPNPALAGENVDKFVQAMQDYQSGKRNNAVMKALATGLTDADIANLAAYYASLK
jgi:cytochrome c553